MDAMVLRANFGAVRDTRWKQLGRFPNVREVAARVKPFSPDFAASSYTTNSGCQRVVGFHHLETMRGTGGYSHFKLFRLNCS